VVKDHLRSFDFLVEELDLSEEIGRGLFVELDSEKGL
jgi:hypothetical protein